jgi:fibronectin type 3 domain-containing protein
MSVRCLCSCLAPLLGLVLGAAGAAAQPTLDPPRQVEVVEAGLRKVTLGWLPSTAPGVDGYLVYRRDPKDGQLKELANVRGWQASRYTDSGGFLRGLQDSTEYVYAVAAYSKDGRVSAPSASVRAVTLGPPAPVAQLAAQAGPRRIELHWRASPELEVAGYRIWRARERDAEYDRVGETHRREDASWTDSRIEPLTEYYYMVTALNAKGVESEPCQPVPAQSLPPPLTPIGLRAASNAVDRIDLHWEANPEANISHYEVLRSTKADRGYRIVGRASSQAPRYIDLAVKPGTLYFYSLLAVDLDGLRSQPSPPIRAFTRSPPLPPTGLVGRLEAGRLLLSWNEPSADPNVAGYLVYQKINYHWQPIARTPQPHFELAVPGAGAVHKFRVSAYVADGLESKPSKVLRIVLEPQPIAADEALAATDEGRDGDW